MKRQWSALVMVTSFVLLFRFEGYPDDKTPASKSKGSDSSGYTQRIDKKLKEKSLQEHGGNQLSEAAVARGLSWIAKQQKEDGRWKFDGRSEDDDIAATGMALMAFLGSGHTEQKVKENPYSTNVKKGLEFLVSKQKKNGEFSGSSNMYSHAIATIALCEAHGMTQNPKLRAPAQIAVSYIVRGQAKNGSWGYAAGTDGDTSILGWQIQALRSAKSSKLTVDDKVWKKATEFLDSVGSESNSQYGYRQKGGTATLSAVGLLSRQTIGWGPQNPSLAKGVQYLKKNPPTEESLDIYYYYYATQVMFFAEGKVWQDFWNPTMRDLLINMQDKKGVNEGRWPKDKGHIGTSCGHFGTTCLAVLTLEVYYRYPPLWKKKGSGSIEELEK
jgi:hypothetical protein